MSFSVAYVRRWAKTLFALLALGALLLLWHRSQAFDPMVYGRVQTTLGQIETTWAELAEDVFRVRHGLGRNYDSLVHNLERLSQLTRSLDRESGWGGELYSEDVQREIRILELAIAQKGRLIERFKTRNAMLRNALLYFPNAIDRLSADPAVEPDLHQLLRRLRVSVLDLHFGHFTVTEQQVQDQLDELYSLSDFYAEHLGEMLRRIAAHGRLIVTIERELEEQLPAIVDRSQRIFVGTLADTYAKEYSRRILVKNLYQIGLFSTALGLLIFGVWTHLRLRYRSGELGTALNRVKNQKHALDEHAIVSATDVDGNFTYANRKFCDISGYCQAELLGKSHRIVNAGLRPRSLFREMLQEIGKGRTWHGEVMNRARDGRPYWVAATVVPFLDDAGKPYEYVSIQTDISYRKQVEEKLQQALEQAKAANRAKSEFLANMSHEIRTPMNGVLGMLQLLMESPLTPEQREYADVARTSAQSLLTLLDDILDFSKIEAGSLAIDSVVFVLRELLAETIKILAFQAEEKGLQLSSSVAADVPDLVLGDPGRLRQILLNLLGNAIKFTEHGKVGVEVVLEEASPDPVDTDRNALVLRFAVTDTGIGIPEEARERVFEAFCQADMSVTRGYGGTGLGLSISARLAQLMGGRIWLESQSGMGSRFYFTVEVGRVAPGVQPAPVVVPKSGVWHGGGIPDLSARKQIRAPAGAGGEAIRVLVVEDFHINQILISSILKKRSCEVTLAENGREAVELFEPGRYDLVLMDVQMPEMDGFEATGLMREREQEAGTHTTIVAMTANAMKGDRERCLEAGMDGYIAKPFNPHELLDVVDRLGPRPGSDVQPLAGKETQTSLSRPRLSGDAPIDRAYALALVGGDEGLLEVVSNAFLADCRNQITLIDQALEGRDQEGAVRAAHSLKGLLGGVGALGAQARARELEDMAKNADWQGVTGFLPKFRLSLDEVIEALRPDPEKSAAGT